MKWQAHGDNGGITNGEEEVVRERRIFGFEKMQQNPV